MKRAILFVLLGVAIGGGIVYFVKKGVNPQPPAGEKAADDEGGGTHVTRDENGNVVITMSDEMQGDNGIKVEKPEAAKWAPEQKGYGRVADPAQLAALLADLASAQATYAASSNELARQKTLIGQGNSSARALEAAKATAQRDELAVKTARDKLIMGWGKPLAEQSDPLALVESLASQATALVRIDLPAGETISAPPVTARIITLSGTSVEGELMTPAPSVDPQMQGRGFIFQVKTNAAQLLAGEAVTGYLKLPGEPSDGVNIPRNAVVRTEGSGWVYVLNEGGEAFTRVPILLDRPTETGWFVSKGVTPANYIVGTGAQTLLSEELKASLQAN